MTWAAAAARLMRRIGLIGWDRAIAQEVDDPSIDCREWARTVAAWMAGEEPPPPAGDDDFEVTYNCYFCCDSGFRMGSRRERLYQGRPVVTSRPCSCGKGQSIAKPPPEAPTAKDYLERSRPGGMRRLVDPGHGEDVT